MGSPREYSLTSVHVARGASYIIMQNIVTNGAQVVTFAILARLITPMEMGILAVLTLVNGLCQIIGTVALPQAVTKFIAESFPRGETRVAASAFYQALRVTFILAMPLGLVIFLAASTLSIALLGQATYVIFFQVLALDILFYAGALPVLNATLLGLQKFKATATIAVANTLLRQTLIISLIVLLHNFVGLVFAWVISDFATTAVYLAYVLRCLGPPQFDFPFRKLLNFSWPLSLGNAISFAYSWFDRAVLLLFVPLATLGVYNATLMAFGVLVAISNALTTVLFPAYSAQQSSDTQNSSNAVRLASRYVSFVLIPLALGLLATARPALALFVGEVYTAGSEPLMVMSGAFAIAAVGTALSPMLLAMEETRIAAVITVGSLVLSLGTAFLLVPVFGMLGASVARGFALLLATALTIAFLARKSAITLDLGVYLRSLLAGFVMAVVVILVQLPFHSKFLLPLYVIVGGITYVTGLRLLKAVQQEDIDLLRSYFGKRLGFATRILSWILLPSNRD